MSLLTELDAVNSMLGLVGELPVNALEDEHPLVPAARSIVARETKLVQADMWWFNTEFPVLKPDLTTKFIYVPNDAAAVDSVSRYPNLAVRGNRLFNTDTSSFIFDYPVQVRLHRVLAFEDLPVTVAQYVLEASSLKFQIQYDGDPVKTRLIQQDKEVARMRMNAEHTRNLRLSVWNRPELSNVIQNISPYVGRGRRW